VLAPATSPLFLDIRLPAHAAAELAVLSEGACLRLATGADPGSALLVAARPLREPVAKYGPFVMNTPQEIHTAIADFRAGRF
jgi:redox-sensitive bicupin YhaK (pirin superfamily)